jgi:hypothetical protein
MDIEIHKLFGDKGVATPTIKNFYQRKTNLRRKTIEEIQQWVEKGKKKEIKSEDEEDNKNKEDINISDNNIIDNNSSSNSES